jgi:hypothetical protein
MNHVQLVQECDQEVTALLPDLPRPEQKAVAAMMCGVVDKRAATLSAASAGIPGDARDPSKLRRAQRLLANPRLDVPAAQCRLVERVLTGSRGRLDLLLDATTTGATARYGGTETLRLSLAWKKRCIPLLWQSRERRRGAQPAWQQVIRRFFAQLAPSIPADCTVTVMADRGLVGRPLLDQILAYGWHYVLRSERTVLIRDPAGTTCPLSTLVPQPGAPSRYLTGVQVYAPRTKRAPEQRHIAGQSTWYRVWSRAVTTNVVAVWRSGDRDPWLLLTDLPARPSRCTDYRHRMWDEEGFRDWKSAGWNWQTSRVRRPERVERLLLILALATLWMCVLAQRVIRRGLRVVLEPVRARWYSAFQLGLRYFCRLATNDAQPPVSLRLTPQARAPVKLS